MPPDLSRELDVACRLAKDAGEAILAVRAGVHHGTSLGTREKDNDEGPVTEADLAADLVLREGLSAAFPGDKLITEETWEHGTAVDPGERAWILDPLDGTREFVRSGDDFSVMIGLSLGGEPALGVVYQPTSGRLWAGVVATGLCFAEQGGERTSLDVRTRPPRDVVRLAVSRSHKGRLAEIVAGAFQADVVERGSVGLKVAMILDDEADIYVSGSRRIKVWDTCGPAALFRAAGGRIESVDGKPLVYVGKAAHGHGVRALIPSLVPEWVPRIDDVVKAWKAGRG